jgi:hypothetical protein
MPPVAARTPVSSPNFGSQTTILQQPASAHTVRGALAGALKKRLGLTVVSEKVEGRGRVYRLCGADRGRPCAFGAASSSLPFRHAHIAPQADRHDCIGWDVGVCAYGVSIRARGHAPPLPERVCLLPPGAGRGRGAGLASRQRGRGDRPRPRSPERRGAAGAASTRLASAAAGRAEPRPVPPGWMSARVTRSRRLGRGGRGRRSFAELRLAHKASAD